MATPVEKRVAQLRQEINKISPIRQVAYEDIQGLVKRRLAAIDRLANQEVYKPSGKQRVRTRQKISKKAYGQVCTKVKLILSEKYAKKHHLLKTDVSDTYKAIVMVRRYINALSDKIDSLVEELAQEYNSEAWNTMIHDKRLKIDTQSSPMEAQRAKAKAKAKGGRGRAGYGRAMQVFSGEETPPSPPLTGMAASTPPMTRGELGGYNNLEVKNFKGPWTVVCGAMKAEATVSADGFFDMHQIFTRGSVPGGWSAFRCRIVFDVKAKTFMTEIDGVLWKMVEADVRDSRKSVVVWESGGDMPQSVWTRAKLEPAQAKVKPKAKTQARSSTRTTNAPLTPPHGASSDGRSSTGNMPGNITPTPSPAEWYTEIRDGRLMWTDGVSAVPADERVSDDSRQKTKMQF